MKFSTLIPIAVSLSTFVAALPIAAQSQDEVYPQVKSASGGNHVGKRDEKYINSKLEDFEFPEENVSVSGSKAVSPKGHQAKAVDPPIYTSTRTAKWEKDFQAAQKALQELNLLLINSKNAVHQRPDLFKYMNKLVDDVCRTMSLLDIPQGTTDPREKAFMIKFRGVQKMMEETVKRIKGGK
ncbi:hypothetical protein JCM33374_g662 [Metschnikowia sp. JCM 33374]|nr:hypothetical protein JCM33374_g662 [Metschnikowia sp. JCM 33374]